MEPTPQGGDWEDIVIDTVVPIASILPLGVPRLGVGGGAALPWKSSASSRSPSSSSFSSPSLPSCPWACSVLVSEEVLPGKPPPSARSPWMSPCLPAGMGGRVQEEGNSMAAANGVRGRAPGLLSAFTAAPTKRVSPSLPTWRAPVGRAAPHSSISTTTQNTARNS